MNKMKAMQSLLGEENKIKRNTDLTPKMGAPAGGSAAGR